MLAVEFKQQNRYHLPQTNTFSSQPSPLWVKAEQHPTQEAEEGGEGGEGGGEGGRRGGGEGGEGEHTIAIQAC